MSCMAVSEKLLVLARGLHVDCYDYSNHSFFDIPQKPYLDDDLISDITISRDQKRLALITSVSKQLIVCNLPNMNTSSSFILPRSASKVRFTAKNDQLIIADKSGDVLIYDISKEDSGTKLLGHLSLLLDILQTEDEKYIITSDRDEKIRVSCYPNTYNIQTYCLGHKEFVNHIEILPNDEQFLTSSSGDGTIKIWDYLSGKLCYSIDTNLDVNDDGLCEKFIKVMDGEGIEVTTLPIVHYAITKLDDHSSVLAVTLHSYNKLLLYTLRKQNNTFGHTKEETFILDKFPTAIQFYNTSLFLYDDTNSCVNIYNVLNTDSKICLQSGKSIKMFQNVPTNYETKLSFEIIRVLYKRKFDNVQEYHERKKQRLEKSAK